MSVLILLEFFIKLSFGILKLCVWLWFSWWLPIFVLTKTSQSYWSISITSIPQTPKKTSQKKFQNPPPKNNILNNKSTYTNHLLPKTSSTALSTFKWLPPIKVPSTLFHLSFTTKKVGIAATLYSWDSCSPFSTSSLIRAILFGMN